MYQITVPAIKWFDYQMWLAQNYMYPVVNYFVYPDGWTTMVVDFIKESDRDRFEERWQHTFD